MIEGYIRFILEGVLEEDFTIDITHSKYEVTIMVDLKNSAREYYMWNLLNEELINKVKLALKDYLPKDKVVVRIRQINIPNEILTLRNIVYK